MSFEEPADTEMFRLAHVVMEEGFRCDGDNPSIVDHPRWPHNVHAFLTALFDFRLKARDTAGAEVALFIAEARPGFGTWSRRKLVDDRLAQLAKRGRLFVNADPLDDPLFVFAASGAESCVVCHGQ